MSEETLAVWFILLQCLMISICLFGLIGNTLCIWVLLQKEMRKTSYNCILLGLGVSDFGLLLLALIRTISNFGVYIIDYNNPWIDLPIFFWDWICTGGTKYFTVAISLERFFAVCFPIKAHHMLTPKKAQRFGFGVFLFTVGISLISYGYKYHWDGKSFNIYAAVVLHFLPFVTVLLLNIFVYIGLKRHQKQREGLTTCDTSDDKITRMLLVVVAVFGFCYSFECLRRIWIFTGHFNYSVYAYHEYPINNLAGIFYAVNSSVNFIIYYLMGQNFRLQFLRLINNTCGVKMRELKISIASINMRSREASKSSGESGFTEESGDGSMKA